MLGYSYGQTRMSSIMKIKLLSILIVCLAMLVAIVGCSTTPTSTPTLTNEQPIEVVSVLQPYELPNPGGPPIKITLRNISTETVVSLNVTIQLSRALDVNFDVTSTNPLLPDKSISSKYYLINVVFSDNVSYPLMINGTLQNGVTFSYTKQAQITAQAYTNEQPIEMVSALGPIPPFHPGDRYNHEGWTVEITLKNVSDKSIISLSAILLINAVDIIYSSDVNFDTTSSNPLLSDKTISSKSILISASGSVSYSLFMTGTLQNGTAFGYTKQVQITGP